MPAAALAQTKSLLGITDTATDAALTEFLELSSLRVNYQLAKVFPTLISGGSQEYLDFETPDKRLRWYDSTTITVDKDFDPVVADTIDLDNGRWTFSTDTTQPILYIRGRSYDPYGAAADYLVSFSAQESGDLTTFSTPGGNFTFSSSEDIANAAKGFDSKRRRMPIEVIRSDINA